MYVTQTSFLTIAAPCTTAGVVQASISTVIVACWHRQVIVMQHAQQGMIPHQAGAAANRHAFKSCSRPRYSHARRTVTAKAGKVTDAGTYTVRGTVRKQNEDRFDLQVSAVRECNLQESKCAVELSAVPTQRDMYEPLLHAD